ncbi:MAG: hypothetical protein VR71_00030 [Roseovarius sp. BRH_c41]|uniref:hypothetical protein n=1 Tax=Roseovarius sp. BRH_c41 TaxID=1629709 RepID=UPI0005F12B34|nr:hypothetical protein [Roseovarius sp. BRH_c41]KJS45893.1 MAG: hypothetical protein VR71_00030 [Roseovarius sp. BRH_c41]
MFKIDQTPTFTHPVEIKVPADGGHDLQTLNATFRVLPDEEIEALDMRTTRGEREFLSAAIVSLDDIEDEKGNKLPYSHGLRDRLIGLAYVRVALVNAYYAALVGKRVKN